MSSSLQRMLALADSQALLQPPAAQPGVEADTNGRYHSQGYGWPLAAIGAHAVVLVGDAQGWSLLVGRRGSKLRHAGKLSLLGGFVDLKDGENFAAALAREAREESNDVLQLDFSKAQLISAQIGYAGGTSPAEASIGYLLIADKATAAQIKAMVRFQSGVNDEVSEHLLLPLDEKLFDAIADAGGFAYGHELRSVLLAAETLLHQPAATATLKPPTPTMGG